MSWICPGRPVRTFAAMEIDSLFGLPAHPLVVHAVVVLLPLAAVGLVVTAALPRSRRFYAPLVFAAAVASTVGVGMAQGSGQALEEQVDETHLVHEHTEQGEKVLPWAIAVLVVSGAVVGADLVARRSPNGSPNGVPKALTASLVAAALIAGAGATWTVIDVGHSGAKATWNDVSSESAGE